MQTRIDTNTANGSENAITLRVNGTMLGAANRTDPQPFDAPLRGIAMSDSPVLVRADRDDDRLMVVARLHTLGRRHALPLFVCTSLDDARPLFERVLVQNGRGDVAGTWAIYGVSSWSTEAQQALARVLAVLDECRLHGRVSHEKMPRIIVVENENAVGGLEPELARRLAFFEIAAGALQSKAKRRRKQ